MYDVSMSKESFSISGNRVNSAVGVYSWDRIIFVGRDLPGVELTQGKG